jgi:signal transduction histidine kinase/ligand-binding sensor domain-containing protein/DNA-binding response OmpR family regulator
MRWFPLLLTFMLLTLTGAAEAESPTTVERTLWYRTLGVSEGLSQGFVSDMAQDHDGYLWFATVDGLNRFDGRRFETFRHSSGDPMSLSAGIVYALHVDRSGQLWVGTDRGLDRFDFATESFVHYHHEPLDTRSPSGAKVDFIDSDQSGNLWFVASSLHRLDAVTGEITRIPVEQQGELEVTAFKAGQHSRLWLAGAVLDALDGEKTGKYRLEVYETGDGSSAALAKRTQVLSELAPEQGPVLAIAEEFSGGIWFGQERGDLARLDSTSREQQLLQFGKGARPTGIRSLARDMHGGLWVLAERDDQLYYLDSESRQAQLVFLRPESDSPKGHNRLKQLFVDRTGVLWISTEAGGLHYVDISSRGFDLYRLTGDAPGSGFVRAILQDSNGTVWVGTPLGLQRLEGRPEDTKSDPFHGLEHSGVEGQNVQAIHEDQRGRIWVGTDRSLVRFDPGQGETATFTPNSEDPQGLGGKWIQVIHEDSQGTIWLGTGFRGLDALRADGDPILHFRHHEEELESLPSNRVQAIASDEAGRLWVGTSAGLAVAEVRPPDAMRFRRFPLANPDLREGSLSAIHPSTRDSGVLWLGWMGLGLSRLDVETGAVRHWTSQDSELPNDTVYAILQDARGRLWLSTNQGLASFDPESESFRAYGQDRGAQSLEFNARAAYQAADGRLFFGGVAGLNAFYPDRLKDNPFPPQVRVHRISVLDRTRVAPTVPFVSRMHVGTRNELLELAPWERDLQFEFAALHYTNPDQNRFSYRLDSFDTGWREPVNETKATYTNLEPGRYTFRVRAMSSHGIWSEETDEVSFRIQPSFYATAWFKGLTILSLGAALAGAFAWRTRSLRSRRAELEREVTERTFQLNETLATVETQARRLAELDRAKSRFFANISHELRTPLTLTIGPLDALKQGRYGVLTAEALANVELAERNARQQLELVDQLLMLAAMESGSVRAERHYACLDEMLRSVASRFREHAKDAGLELQLELPVESVWFNFDEEKLKSVVTNLLSNACKYTPAGGRVVLRLRSSREEVTLEVEDTGIGIPEEVQGRVFERFYRDVSEHSGRPGTGIGLALVAELVELLEGRVNLQSQPGSGSIFVVKLPRLMPANEHEDDTIVQETPRQVSTDPELERPMILLVEDHAEMRSFIRQQLEDQFDVIEADEGYRALEIARRQVPDLLLSDVMMDDMDGFELCEEFHADPELAHVPIILLTARADQESRLEGLGRGADDYLVKPFVRQELKLRVGNQLASRQRLRQRLLQEARQTSGRPDRPNMPATATKDDVFRHRLNEVLESNALETSFSVTELASELAISRSKLFRRVGEVCEATPAELILRFRLERAAELLLQNAGDVGEIAYGVGFKSTSHFIRRFKEQFGVTPAGYASAATVRSPNS